MGGLPGWLKQQHLLSSSVKKDELLKRLTVRSLCSALRSSRPIYDAIKHS